jgi:hypothetical protein
MRFPHLLEVLMSDDLAPRVDLLEHLQAQQERLNALLIDVTGRLNDEHALYATLLPRQEMRLELLTTLASQHEERMAKLQQTLDAIKDMLERGNGR